MVNVPQTSKIKKTKKLKEYKIIQTRYDFYLRIRNLGYWEVLGMFIYSWATVLSLLMKYSECMQ